MNHPCRQNTNEVRAVHFKVKLGALLLVLLSFFAVTFSFASAHSNGASIEKQVDDTYLVDIGYSPDKVQAHSQVRLDFQLRDVLSKDEVAFSDLWLRIEKVGQLYFAGGLDATTFDNAIISYRFPEAGEYDLSVRFYDETQPIVETSVTFSVAEEAHTPAVWYADLSLDQTMLFSLLLGIIVLILVLLLTVRLKAQAGKKVKN